MKLRNKKTGEIGKLHCDMNVSPSKYGVFEDTGIRGHYWEYGSLAELNAEWEDYGPKEPLIKDEKIRKAVLAWSEVVGGETFIVSYNMEHHDCCIYTGNLSDTATIDFGIDLNLKEGSYTIDELCGEEEE